MKNKGNLRVTTPSEKEIAMTRVFDAPRNLVFDALTKPELIQRWLLGPAGWTMVVCEVDLKVGGAYRYVLRQANRSDVAWGGVFREIVRPERLVHTEAFDDYPGESLVTTILVEEHGKTTMTATMLFESQMIRDAVIKSGMEDGAAEGYDRLAVLLTTTSEVTK